MNTYIFTIRANRARKTGSITIRATSMEEARVAFDASRSANVALMQVREV